MLRTIAEKNPFVQFAYVVDIEGRLVAKGIENPADKALYKGVEKEDYSDRDWFRHPLKDGKIFVSELFSSKYTNNLIFTASSCIIDAKGKELGVLGLDIRFEELAKLEPVTSTVV